MEIGDPVAIRDGSDEDEELKLFQRKHYHLGQDLDDSSQASAVNGGNSREGSVKNDEKMKGSNMVLRNLLRGSRYFDPSNANCCYRCGDQGHTSFNCPTPTKRPRKPCFLCGSFRHVANQCLMGHDYCDDGGSTSETDICLRCGTFGHDMVLCKYEYSEDDLKDVKCYVCGSFDHLCCVEPCNSPSSAWAVSCYRCGQLGHTGLACGRHYEDEDSVVKIWEKGHFLSEFDRNKQADEKKKRRLEKALAASTAIRAELEKKKQKKQQMLEECVNSSQLPKRKRETTTPSLHESGGNSEQNIHAHESNGKMKKKRKGKNKKTEDEQPEKPNLEEHSTLHESNEKKKKNNDENSEQNIHAHESNGKMKKKKGKRKKKKKAEDEPLEKPNYRSGLITEDSEEDAYQRGKIRRLSSPITPSGHNHRLPTTHMGLNHSSPRFVSGGCYPGSQSTTPYGRNRINSSFEPNGHLSGHSPSRLWQRYYPPTSLPVSPWDHNRTYMDHNHRSPTFSSGGNYLASLSTAPCGGNHRDSSFESNRRVLDPPLLRRHPYYDPTSPIAPSRHNYHMLPTTYMGHNHISPTFSSGRHYPGSLPITPYGENHGNPSFESNGYLSGLPTSRWEPYAPTSSHHHHHHQQQHMYSPTFSHDHHQQQQHMYSPAPSRYGPAHHYGRW